MDLESSIKAFASLKEEVKNVEIRLVTKGINADFLVDFIKKTGHLNYAENYASELKKWDSILELFPEVKISFIGSFQTGNIKNIIKYCDKVEGISSLKYLEKIKHEAKKKDKKIKCYAQINIADEKQKNGFSFKELNLAHLKEFDGLMCIPPVVKSPTEYFKRMQNLAAASGLKELSMGMSRDYNEAIKFGATEIRIGNLVFNARL